MVEKYQPFILNTSALQINNKVVTWSPVQTRDQVLSVRYDTICPHHTPPQSYKLWTPHWYLNRESMMGMARSLPPIISSNIVITTGGDGRIVRLDLSLTDEISEFGTTDW